MKIFLAILTFSAVKYMNSVVELPDAELAYLWRMFFYF